MVSTPHEDNKVPASRRQATRWSVVINMAPAAALAFGRQENTTLLRWPHVHFNMHRGFTPMASGLDLLLSAMHLVSEQYILAPEYDVLPERQIPRPG